jgi:hypothetical protein
MKRQNLVVAALLLAATTILPGVCSAETQFDFLRNKNNNAKTSFQYRALAAEPQRKLERRAYRRTARTARRVSNPLNAVARQFTPRQIERNATTIIRAPFDAVDGAYQWFKRRAGKNYSGFTCLGCGRGQRIFNVNHGLKDCAGGDHVLGWMSPACTTQASAGQLGSLRITYYRNGSGHIERVIGTCGKGKVLVGDDNGPGGVSSIRCVPIAGAYAYRMPIPSEGPVKVYAMQKDPCNGKGRGPKHWVNNEVTAFGILASR